MPILSAFGALNFAGLPYRANTGGIEPPTNNGYYSNGYYVDGVLTAALDNNPHEAIDEAGVYYTYSMEDGLGSYFNGLAYNLQGDNLAYSYSTGVGSFFNGLAYNLQGDNKAYNYVNGVLHAECNDAAYNLQGDNLAHSYSSGVDLGVFTGILNGRMYWEGEDQGERITYQAAYECSSGAAFEIHVTGEINIGDYMFYSAFFDEAHAIPYDGWAVINGENKYRALVGFVSQSMVCTG